MIRGLFLPLRTVVTVGVLAAALVLGAGVAAAAPKTISVLGIEVGGSNVTQQATDAAVELTTQLRKRAGIGSSPQYTVAGAPKELLDEKLLFSCQNEDPPCLTKIAGDLNVQVLLFGNLQSDTSHTQYVITLKLFDASTHTFVRILKGKTVPVGDLVAGSVTSNELAKKLYAEITGESLNVTLTLKIDGSESGTVKVNDLPAQPYSSGIAKPSVPEGRVRIVIEPNEKTVQRYEETIQVGGDTTKDIRLAPMPTTTKPENPPLTGNGTGSAATPCSTPGCQDTQQHEYGGTVSDTGRPGKGWRVAFVASTIATVGSIGLATYAYTQLTSTGSESGFYKFGGKCNQSPPPSQCGNGPTLQTESYVGWAGIGVFGALAVVALYEGYIKHDAPATTEHADNAHRKRRERFVVTPVVGSTSAGAQVQLNW
jgi:hypothetical protein